MTLSLVKTGAIAAAMLIATASSSFAATWAMVDQDTNVRAGHSNGSAVVNYVEEGDVVQIIGHWGNWYKIAIPGPNGWVRSYKLDIDYEDDPSSPGIQFCFTGPFGGYVCANS